jgi:hypothetical protein
MPSDKTSDKQAAVSKFVCEVEATALLNCIAAEDYVEHKCVSLMKKLRKCVQKERLVKFELLPDESQGEDKRIVEEKVETTHRP